MRSGPMTRPYFYPRSPCGERPATGQIKPGSGTISIHALLAESDFVIAPTPWASLTFLSTLSLRRATIAGVSKRKGGLISIHALLAESDYRSYNLCSYDPRFLSTLSLRRATKCPHTAPATMSDFYPRSPCGERHSYMGCCQRYGYFYPRSPCGERLLQAWHFCGPR